MATKIQGLASLQRKLAAIPNATKAEVKKVLEVSAAEMVALAKSLAAANVDSGDLQLSIRQEPGANDLAIVVRAGGEMTTREVRAGSGVEYDYAFANEHGTVEMPEQPFFWPSYRSVKKRAKSRASRAIRKGVRRAIAGGTK